MPLFWSFFPSYWHYTLYILILYSLGTSYISDTGHKVVNLVVHEESSQLMKVSKISIKVEVGDHRPKAVIVFLTSTNPTEEGRKEKLEQYDTWTAEDFQKMENGYV